MTTGQKALAYALLHDKSKGGRVVSWLIGGRDGDFAEAFMNDVASRLATRVQLTTDGLKAYLEAVEGAFGADIDYRQWPLACPPRSGRSTIFARRWTP